ncbi:unnamed protein product [Trichobilharzia regenti]|nr:unnamed protein product [Trichobilharzia regenti]
MLCREGKGNERSWSIVRLGRINQLNQSNQRLSKQLDDALKESSIKDADKVVLERRIKSAEEEIHRLRTTTEQHKHANNLLHRVSYTLAFIIFAFFC